MSEYQIIDAIHTIYILMTLCMALNIAMIYGHITIIMIVY